MSTDIRLCSECRKINFESLFFVPNLGNDPNAQGSMPDFQDDGTRLSWTTYKDLPIGSIPTVARRRGSCDLCAFFLEVAHDNGVVDRDIDWSGSPDDDESDTQTTSEKWNTAWSTSRTSRKATRSRVSLIHFADTLTTETPFKRNPGTARRAQPVKEKMVPKPRLSNPSAGNPGFPEISQNPQNGTGDLSCATWAAWTAAG